MLSQAQQNKIVQLLGYGIKSIQVGSVIYDKVMNDRLNALAPAGEQIVIGYLNQIAAIETQMNQAPARLAAKEVDNIKMNLDELGMLRRERRKIAREMADVLDIPYVGTGSGGLSVSN